MIQKPSTCKGCPLYTPPFGKPTGWVPQEAPTGASNGVLIIAEAAGADEEASGRPLVGMAGHFLFSQFARVDLHREGFRLHNVLSCRPPANKLTDMPYEDAAIKACSSNLDATIFLHRAAAREAGLTPVLLTLGKIAFKRVMGYDDKHPVMRKDYQCYPHWNEAYASWVIAADHPSFLMRGKTSRIPILLYAVQRAVEIAKDGLALRTEDYLEDPSSLTAANWVSNLLAKAKDHPNLHVAYDIETPFKQKIDDEEEVSRTQSETDDYTILRISFAYLDPLTGKVLALSIPWTTDHLNTIFRVFSSGLTLVGWNLNYDSPRVRAAGANILGQEVDAMLAWHVLNTSMPKSLGFVTPFYVKDTTVWKHLSDSRPAFYNAKDSAMTILNWHGIESGLKKNNLWHVFQRHVIDLNRMLTYMADAGVPLDPAARQEAETILSKTLAETDAKIQQATPIAAKELKVYKKTPKSLDGLVQTHDTLITKQCPACGAQGVKADHFKATGPKKLKAGIPPNPCAGFKPEKVEIIAPLWAEVQPFKLSKTSLERYQKLLVHRPVIDRKEQKVTFDDKAIKTLCKHYPKDHLYPLIGEFRGTQKLLGAYVGVTDPDTGHIRGGMPVGPDGRVHTTFSHNPSTLRLASQNPNLQNLPRPRKGEVNIRDFIKAPDNHLFIARDFSGIEAVLVGYEAQAPNYMRLALRDVHSFYTAYAIHGIDPGRFPANDLPLLSWDDDKLFTRLGEIKKAFGSDRNALYKHLVHAINFGQGAKGAQEKIYSETGTLFDLGLISKVMDLYKELFPEIPKWHHDIRLQAEKDGYLRNSFGYVHRFNRVFSYKKNHLGMWEKTLGDDAEAVLAFKPQSNAAGIIKEAALRVFENRFNEAGKYLRLLIHDEIFCEAPENEAPHVDAILKEEMERPITCMPLPPSWNMGTYLRINTEGKRGRRWGSMK